MTHPPHGQAHVPGGPAGRLACAVAADAYVRYAAEKYGRFAQQMRRKVKEEGGVWSADAVYSITPTLPRRLTTTDAETAVADCAERGIPTV
ncbi:hypothetical protein OEZ60_03795 [Defluviimonas sp. WL0024]|uniref:Uncharacterized protein n=1 Tax=Albidovulum salinarum TaxID=2984153 RepID=A0ABT2X5M5_9RHOB|nr:hypothetical protein [Defluviimonas sp. WL0024]MCU9847120.1 hypothetical protein [Defluviimonas sp. WL0024]